MYAVKLPLKSPDISAPGVRQLGAHLIPAGHDKPSLVRHVLTRADAKKILRCLPSALWRHCLGISYAQINPLPPHIHTEETAVVNFYLQTSGEETVFYSGNIVRVKDAVQDDGNNFHVVDPKPLREAQRFVAQPGDVWVLPTRVPHAVFASGSDAAPRVVVQVYLDVCVEDIVKLLT